MTTCRLPRRLRLDRLPRVIPIVLGLFLVLAGCAKCAMLRASHIDVDTFVNGIVFPVELAAGVMLCGPGRRLAALFLALLMPLAAAFLEFLRSDGYEAADWWWFLPLPLPFVPHLVVLATLGVGGAAVFFREETRLADRADGVSGEAGDLRRLISLFR